MTDKERIHQLEADLSELFQILNFIQQRADVITLMGYTLKKSEAQDRYDIHTPDGIVIAPYSLIGSLAEIKRLEEQTNE